MDKNIWILNHYAGPPEITGGVRHYKFARNLISKGYSVTVFAASSQHNSKINLIMDSSKYIYKEYDGVPFVFIKTRNYIGNSVSRIFNMLDYSIGLLSISKKFDYAPPNIIIASSVHPLTWISGYRLARRYNAKFIAETRDLWPETLVAMGKISRKNIIARVLYKLEKFIYKKADNIIFTFPGGKDYVESIGLDTSKVRYINNGVDIEEFNRNLIHYHYEDIDLGKKGSFKVVFTGSIGLANGIENLLDAAKELCRLNYDDINIIIFGDGPERLNLEKKVIELGLRNISFKGRVEKKYIPSILNQSSLNIFSLEHLPELFKYGLSPNKMFEYFASGRPILSNVECGYDMLEQYKCGITVKGKSTEELVNGILKFYQMKKDDYEEYSQNALRAAHDFDFKILTDKLEEIILEN